LRLAGALYRFWYVRGYLTEGRQWLEAALAKGADAGPGPRAKALHAAGYLAWGQGDFERARTLYEQSLNLYRGLDDKRGLARTLNSFAVVSRELGSDERAAALYEEGLAVARESGATDLVGSLLNNMAEIARVRGDYDRARALYEEALSSRGRVRDFGTLIYLFNLGQVAFAQGDFAEARSFFLESLGIAKELGDRLGSTSCLEGLAGVYALQGEPARAAQLLGAADALRKALNAPVQSADRADYERFVAGARAAMDADAFEAAWAEGRSLTLEQAIELALADTGLDGAGAPSGTPPRRREDVRA
jgi:tetratricopeptide (TPR) repeat protein